MPASRKARWIVGIVFVASAIGLSAPAAVAVERHVPGEYATIQAAIDACADGDEVIIAPGTYTGEGNRDIDFNGKAITVRSTDPGDPAVVAATIIDCQGTSAERHRGFKFHSGEGAPSVLTGLTITHGFAPSEPVGTTTIALGGGIYCAGASPTITRCTIARNATDGEGGGIYCWSGAGPTIANCMFLGNTAFAIPDHWAFGGGLVSSDGQGTTVTDCVFAGNAADGGGGLVSYGTTGDVISNSLIISRCTFTGNSAIRAWGGGLYTTMSATHLADCVVTGNSAMWGGGGARITFWSRSVFNNCLFIGNAATNTDLWDAGSGGGLAVSSQSDVTLANCTFGGNLASDSAGRVVPGGAIGVRWFGPKIVNSILWGNSAGAIGLGSVSGRPTSVSYSDVEGGWSGPGNLNADPLFPVGPGGTWTSDGAYDSARYQVTFTDANATWQPDELVGRFVNPKTTQWLQFAIVANTATTITIWADWATVGAGVSWVASGASYRIYDYHLSQTAAGQASDSPCVNVGFGPASLRFVSGSTRTDGVDDADVVDMGYHYNAQSIPLTRSDFDLDGDVDLDDFLHFQDCFNGPNQAPRLTTCIDAQLDADTDVDVADFLIFQDCFNGPDRPPKCL